MNLKLKTLLLLLIIPLLTIAQNVVTGTVIDAGNGLPIPNAYVTFEGNEKPIETDFDGIFKLKNIPDGAIILISYTGYTTQEIIFTGQNKIDIELTEQPTALELDVLIGYGHSKQLDISTSHQTITQNQFNKGAITSTTQLIAGKAAGVQVTAASGRPGDNSILRIRPGATLSLNQDALYVVDGIPLDQNNARLNSINPNDINSFTILKDAAATAIYGNRASNGVILITTKKADFNTDLNINYNVQFAVEKVDNYTPVFTANRFRQFINDQGRDASILGTASTDWQDAIYENATRAIHNISVEKGYESTAIRASLGYNNENGTLQGSGYERANLGLNITQKLLRNKLQLHLTSQLTKEEIRSADLSAIRAAILFDPTQPIFNDDNEFFEHSTTNGVEPNAVRNPLGLLNSLDAQLDNDQVRINMRAVYQLPAEGLKFTGNTGLDYNEFNSYAIRNQITTAGTLNTLKDVSHGIRRNNLIDGRLDYHKESENYKTQMDLTLGSSSQSFYRGTFNRGIENGVFIDFPSIEENNSITSFFSRAIFDINNRFMLSGSFSINSNDHFSSDNKWAHFYGLSGAMKLTETGFIKNNLTISHLKLRGSYGKTGQQNITTAHSLIPENNVYQFGNEFNGFLKPTNAENLKWETTNEFNIGLDIGLFTNRLTGSIDYYNRKTTDLIIFNLQSFNFQNSGSIKSNGIETSLQLKMIEGKNMTWNITGNLTFQDIEITNLSNSTPVENSIQEWILGTDPTTFNVFRQVYDTNGRPLEGEYEDVNGDNIINNEDRVAYKKANHDAYYGISTYFRFKNFDLNATLRGATGGYNYNEITASTANLTSVFPSDTQNILYNNSPVSIQETGFNDAQLFSDYYIQKADFLKLDNLSIGYNFPGDTIDIRASLTGTNLFTITEYDGIDPEVFNGIDNNLLPRNRGIIFGLGFNF